MDFLYDFDEPNYVVDHLMFYRNSFDILKDSPSTPIVNALTGMNNPFFSNSFDSDATKLFFLLNDDTSSIQPSVHRWICQDYQKFIFEEQIPQQAYDNSRSAEKFEEGDVPMTPNNEIRNISVAEANEIEKYILTKITSMQDLPMDKNSELEDVPVACNSKINDSLTSAQSDGNSVFEQIYFSPIPFSAEVNRCDISLLSEEEEEILQIDENYVRKEDESDNDIFKKSTYTVHWKSGGM